MSGGRAAPIEKTGALGFDSLFGLLAWGGALLLLLAAPSQVANFWPGDYNFWPQSLFTLLLAGVAILLAISRLPVPKWDGVALCLSLFLGWSLLSVFTGAYAHDAWLELARVTGALSFFFIVRAFPRPAQKAGLIAAAVLGLTWLAISFPVPGVSDRLGALFNFALTRDPRQFGTFLNPNLFANALALAHAARASRLPLALWTLTRKRAISLIAGAMHHSLCCCPRSPSRRAKAGWSPHLVGLALTMFALRAARPAAFKARRFVKALPVVVLVG